MFGGFLKLFKLVHKVEGPKNVVKQPMNKRIMWRLTLLLDHACVWRPLSEGNLMKVWGLSQK